MFLVSLSQIIGIDFILSVYLVVEPIEYVKHYKSQWKRKSATLVDINCSCLQMMSLEICKIKLLLFVYMIIILYQTNIFLILFFTRISNNGLNAVSPSNIFKFPISTCAVSIVSGMVPSKLH